MMSAYFKLVLKSTQTGRLPSRGLCYNITMIGVRMSRYCVVHRFEKVQWLRFADLIIASGALLL